MSEKYIASGLASVIVATVPIYIALLGWLSGMARRPKPIVWLGLAGGFFGVAILLGPALKLSSRLRLLEEADNRRIRRGDAIDLIESTQRQLEKRFAVAPRGAMQIFATRYAAFAAVYIVIALAWCAVVALH